MMADIVGVCYWLPPAHQHVLVGETIALQVQNAIAHLQQIHVHDVDNYEWFYYIFSRTYIFY